MNVSGGSRRVPTLDDALQQALGVLLQSGETGGAGVAARPDQIGAARKGRQTGGISQLTHHSAQPSPQAVPYHRRAGAASHGERHPRWVAAPVEEIADLE